MVRSKTNLIIYWIILMNHNKKAFPSNDFYSKLFYSINGQDMIS